MKSPRASTKLRTPQRHRAELEKQRDQAAKLYEKLAADLSRKRTRRRQYFEQASRGRIEESHDGRHAVSNCVKQGQWTATGFDEMAFLVSPNRGEELKALEKIASGGELSRIALALKTAIGDSGKQTGIPRWCSMKSMPA